MVLGWYWVGTRYPKGGNGDGGDGRILPDHPSPILHAPGTAYPVRTRPHYDIRCHERGRRESYGRNNTGKLHQIVRRTYWDHSRTPKPLKLHTNSKSSTKSDRMRVWNGSSHWTSHGDSHANSHRSSHGSSHGISHCDTMPCHDMISKLCNMSGSQTSLNL